MPKSKEELNAKLLERTWDWDSKCSVTEIQQLIDEGADVNASSSKDHYDALMSAIGNTNTPVVKLLLQNGANPNKKDNRGFPTIIAGGNVDLTITKYVFFYGARRNEKFKYEYISGKSYEGDGKNYTVESFIKKHWGRAYYRAMLIGEAAYHLNKSIEANDLVKFVKSLELTNTIEDLPEVFQLLDEYYKHQNTPNRNLLLNNLQYQVYNILYQHQQKTWKQRITFTVITGLFLLPLLFTIPWLIKYRAQMICAEDNLAIKFAPTLIKKVKHQLKNTTLANAQTATASLSSEKSVVKNNGQLRKTILDDQEKHQLLMSPIQRRKYHVLRKALTVASKHPDEILNKNEAENLQQDYQSAKISHNRY